jgi:hypothetical protein
MSKIIRSTDSEVFDIYSSVMSKYLKKEAGNPILEGALALLRAGEKTLDDVLPGMMRADDFIAEAVKTGLITAEEMAQLTGRNVDEIKRLSGVAEVAQDVAEVGVKVAPEVAETAARVTSEIVGSTRVIREEVNKIQQIVLGLKAIDGMPPEEIALLISKLKASRSAMKGQVTKAKNLASQATEQSAELARLLDDSRKAEAILAKTADIIPSLEKKIVDMGGQLDEAGKLITNLEGEVASAAKTIEELAVKGIRLTEENEKLLKTSLEKTELAEILQVRLDDLVASGKGGTPKAKAVADATAAATKEADEGIEAVVKSAPESTEAVKKAKVEAKKKAAAEAAAAKAAGKTPAQKDSLMSKLILKNSGLLLTAAGTAGVGLAGAGIALAGTIATGLLTILSFVAVAGLLGGGAVLAWNLWYAENPLVAKKKIQDLRNAQADAVRKLGVLKFREGSAGKEKTELLIGAITASSESIIPLNDVDTLTQEQFDKAMEDLSAMELAVDDYVDSQELTARDLESRLGWDEAIKSLEYLSATTMSFKELVLLAMQKQGKLPSEEERAGGISDPVARPAPDGAGQPEERGPDHVPHPITIYGEEVDIGHLSRGMRSAAPRMIQKVMNSPEGLAFVDPDGRWGGWLPKTPVKGADGEVIQNKQADYLRALKYLYLNKVFNRGDLRKFVRKNLAKVGRKRMSGWRDAVKYYRGRVGKYANQENNEFFTQKFGKPANSNGSSVILSNNGKTLEMQKKADQISKEYFQDAVSGLADQYAKSYYTGLKSMYDQKPGRTEADFVKLYEVHNESGADLIGSAHPKTVEIADAMGNGGVVENQIEQHRHNTGVAKSMPSGNFRGKHAWVIQNLVKLADQADESGMKEASDLIDEALKKLSSF